MVKHEKYNFCVGDVSEIYAGPGGKLWEYLMGEQIHVGGADQTDYLAHMCGLKNLNSECKLLDICSALGGPIRQLANKFPFRFVGLDITPEMVSEARKRTRGTLHENRIEFKIGSGLDIPARSEEFHIVWGQDAWCYIRDKQRLIQETFRVLKPGGILAFTDWIWGFNSISKTESDNLMDFMVFPDMENLDGYNHILSKSGYKILQTQDLSPDFMIHLNLYLQQLQNAKSEIIANFGENLYCYSERGLLAWRNAAQDGKVGRGCWIAKKE